MGVKIKEAKLVDILTEDCLFPISDGSGEPKVADFSKVKNLLGDARQVESTVTSIQRKISYLTRNGQDSELSVKDIAERIITPTTTNVETLIGQDRNKSVRTIANEVLAGASTGGDIDLGLYLSKSEAEGTYEKKGTSYTKKEIDDNIIKPLAEKADKETVEDLSDEISTISTSVGNKADRDTVENLSERVEQTETTIVNNSNLLAVHSQELLTLQTNQGNQETTLQGQGVAILALQMEVGGVKDDVSEVSTSIDDINDELEKKANKEDVYTTTTVDAMINEAVRINGEELNKKADIETVEDLSAAIGGSKEAIEKIIRQVATNTEDIKGKVDKTDYDAKVAELTDSINEISNTAGDLPERVEQAEADIDILQEEQGTQKVTIQQQAQNIANLNTALENKADMNEVYSRSEVDNTFATITHAEGYAEEVANAAEENAKNHANTIKSNLEQYVEGQLNAVTDVFDNKLKNKADSSTVTDLSNKVSGISNTIDNIQDDMATQGDINGLTSDINELSKRVDGKADKGEVQALVSQIDSKVDQNAYNKNVEEMTNAINGKVGKTDTIPAENVGNLSDGAKGLASTNPIIANRIPFLKADAFAFLQPEDFTVEVAYDGSTWETLNSNDPKLLSMFTMKNFTEGFLFDGFSGLWGINSKVRITISPTSARNAHIDFITVSMFCNSWRYDIKSEYYDIRRQAWIEVGTTNIEHYDDIAYIKYGQYFAYNGWNRWGTRLTFTVKTPYESYSRILSISGFGSLFNETLSNTNNAPYTLGTIWNWDYLKNVYFPNEIYEGETSLKNKYASITSAIQNIESANDDYITISPKGGTTVPTKVIGAKTASINGGGNGLATAQDVRASMPTELPNPKQLKYTVNGISVTYNGLSEATIPTIYAPNQVGSQGQLLQSMGGGVPQWTNLSEIKEAIGFAKDLTGVLLATPEEFTYRPSAGNNSIRDEGAVIRCIKGNTVVWHQYAPSGDNPGLTSGSSKYLTVGIENSEWIGTVQNVDSSCTNPWQVGIHFNTPKAIANHKYLICMNIYTSKEPIRATDYFSLEFGGSTWDISPLSEQAGKWFSASRIFTQTSVNSRTYAIIRPYWSYTYKYGVQNGDYYKVKDVMLFDLTLLFGKGYEPQTYEAFRAIYPDVYPYCAPTIRNLKTTAIETVGFNLFNGLFAELIGGKTYYIGGSNIGTLKFYPNSSSLSEDVVLDANNTFTPLVSGKLRSNGSDVCVHFQHSGIKDGECADYVKHTLNLPEIAKYFPDGMNGNANVWDEINAENAIKRFGVVDLGSLEWGVVGTANDVDRRIYSYGLNNVAKGTASTGVVGNIMCAKYNAISADQNYLRNKGISIAKASSGVMVHIYDPNYNSNDKIDDLVASLNGVLLYYELAEPVVTPILEPIQLVYDVEDFGTEKAISIEDSAPFRADIVYQFNAEGRIRDNGRNIERLESQIRSYHDDGAKVTIDREIITTKSIIGNSEFRYALPDAPQDVKDDADGTLATEYWVRKNIPTEIATATQKDRSSPSIGLNLKPNIVYEFNNLSFLGINSFVSYADGYDYVWTVRFGVSTTFNFVLTEGITVYWEDGIAPTYSYGNIYELIFRRVSTGSLYLGEWKVYK